MVSLDDPQSRISDLAVHCILPISTVRLYPEYSKETRIICIIIEIELESVYSVISGVWPGFALNNSVYCSSD